MNVALYCRVSTEEQAKFGFSIKAQLNELREYAIKNNYTIVGEYLDEGISGGKIDRPALNSLLEDVKSGNIDLILFVKLDRWFRSVAHYYKIQEILEKYNVKWKATQEDYETQTSSGQFKVNIMLSVSQQFKDATGERIKSVFDYKVKVLKEAITSASYGYNIVDKHYVINEEEAKNVVKIYDDLLETHSLRQAGLRFMERTGKVSLRTAKRILKNSVYCGLYNYNGEIIRDYYPPIISEDTFNKAQEIIKHNIKQYLYSNNEVKNSYLFVGLIKCPMCGRKMSGCKKSRPTYKFYRCPSNYANRCCKYKKIINEEKIEQKILDKICLDFNSIINIKPTKQKRVKKQDTVSPKIERLKNLFIDGIIDKQEFDSKFKELNKQLEDIKKYNAESNKHMYELDKLIKSGTFREIYNSLNDERKQIFWKNLIDSIIIKEDDILINWKG